MQPLDQYVLVTGAGSGIGLATARLLGKQGYQVFAGVHHLASAPGDLPKNVRALALDVTDPDSLIAAMHEIRMTVGDRGLFALINNAGAGDIMPLEFTPMQRFRDIFEVNVFGVLACTQAVLPLIRAGHGRIINIGSVGGLITIPFGGSLTASKHAIEAISDALRLELSLAKIPVTCIEPASINSGSAEKLAAKVEDTIAQLPETGRLQYGGVLRAFTKTMIRSETHGSPPEVVAEAVLRVLKSQRPPARMLVGKGGRLLKFIAKFLPDSIRDRLLQRVFIQTR